MTMRQGRNFHSSFEPPCINTRELSTSPQRDSLHNPASPIFKRNFGTLPGRNTNGIATVPPLSPKAVATLPPTHVLEIIPPELEPGSSFTPAPESTAPSFTCEPVRPISPGDAKTPRAARDFHEQFAGKDYEVQIVKTCGRTTKEIDPSVREHNDSPEHINLYTLESGEKMHVFFKRIPENPAARYMSYLIKSTPIHSTSESLEAEIKHKNGEEYVVFDYKGLGEYEFNAVCIGHPVTDLCTDPKLTYVGVLLKSHDDPVFQNKLYLDYIRNLQTASDITQNGGNFLATANNIVIRKVDSNGDRDDDDIYAPMLFLREIGVDAYEFHAYVRENDGIKVDVSNTEQYVAIHSLTVPDNKFDYSQLVEANPNYLDAMHGYHRVTIGKLFPTATKPRMCVFLSNRDDTEKEVVEIRVSKLTDELYNLIKEKTNHESPDDDSTFKIEQHSVTELTAIIRQIKERQGAELEKHIDTAYEKNQEVYDFIMER